MRWPPVRCPTPLLLALLVAAPSSAQGTGRADELHDQAADILASSGGTAHSNLEAAARLHLRSATLRTSEDPRAEACIVEAANLLRIVDSARAVTVLEIAGQRAEARGDQLAAASAYLDAAHLTIGRTLSNAADAARARMLLERAERIAGSPTSIKERASILVRPPNSSTGTLTYPSRSSAAPLKNKIPCVAWSK